MDELILQYAGADVIYLGVFSIVFIFTLIIFEYVYSIKQPTTTSQIPSFANIKDEDVIEEIKKANADGFNENVNPQPQSDVLSINQKNHLGHNNNEVLSIKIKNLEKIYTQVGDCGVNTEVVAVDKLSLCLNYGECFALLGVNGAGKTSTFKCLTNEENPTGGNIVINGMNITNNFNKIRNLIGYCPQFDAIFEFLTVYENLEFYANVKGVSSDKIEQLIECLLKELNLKQYIDKISGRLR